MINNFPNALITIFVKIGLCFGIAYFLEINLGKKWARNALITFTALPLFVLSQVIFKFGGGSYSKALVSGMMLFSILRLFCLVFL
jgi:hypothetical protein